MSSKLQRLFVKSRLETDAEIALGKDQAHYLGNVLRLKRGERLLLFNGEDGEWCAEL
ncbi:MAG: RNA methyltransferase PUA domain-containing protein, partial [Methyloceanibacter sp.]